MPWKFCIWASQGDCRGAVAAGRQCGMATCWPSLNIVSLVCQLRGLAACSSHKRVAWPRGLPPSLNTMVSRLGALHKQTSVAEPYKKSGIGSRGNQWYGI